MKISTRGRYGLRALIDIASQKDNKRITIKTLSERQGVSEHYLEQIIAILKKAGMVKSIRGAQGGYILNASPYTTSVGDILRILEGSLSITGCTDERNESTCGNSTCDNCVTKSVWERIQNSIDEIVNNITLHELVEDYKLLNVIEKGDFF